MNADQRSSRLRSYLHGDNYSFHSLVELQVRSDSYFKCKPIWSFDLTLSKLRFPVRDRLRLRSNKDKMLV